MCFDELLADDEASQLQEEKVFSLLRPVPPQETPARAGRRAVGAENPHTKQRRGLQPAPSSR